MTGTTGMTIRITKNTRVTGMTRDDWSELLG